MADDHREGGVPADRHLVGRPGSDVVDPLALRRLVPPRPGRHRVLQAAVGATDEDARRRRRVRLVERLGEESVMGLGDRVGAVPGDLAGAVRVPAQQVVEAGLLAGRVPQPSGQVRGGAEHERVGEHPGVRAPVIAAAGRRVRGAVPLPGDRGQVDVGGGDQRGPGARRVGLGRPAGGGGQREQTERGGLTPVEAVAKAGGQVDIGAVELVAVDIDAGECAQLDGGPVPLVPDVDVVVGATADHPGSGRVAGRAGRRRHPGPPGSDRAAAGEDRVVGPPHPGRLRGDSGQPVRRRRGGRPGQPGFAVLIGAERQRGPPDVVHGVEDHAGLRVTGGQLRGQQELHPPSGLDEHVGDAVAALRDVQLRPDGCPVAFVCVLQQPGGDRGGHRVLAVVSGVVPTAAQVVASAPDRQPEHPPAVRAVSPVASDGAVAPVR